MTTKELIEKLSACPPETQVIISDADTGWDLKLMKAEFSKIETGKDKYEPAFVIGGDYDNTIQWIDLIFQPVE